MRELCYIVQAVGFVTVGALVLPIDLLYCGLCLYIVAMYKELQILLGGIDQKPKVLHLKKYVAVGNRKSLCECIEFHLAVIR